MLWIVVATVIGTLVAFLLVPMRSLGPDNWKIAAALMGSYIGGCKCLNKFFMLDCGMFASTHNACLDEL